MFSQAMNVVVGPKIGRKLLTGSYVVEDVMCSKCGEKLGWKYVETFNLKQRHVVCLRKRTRMCVSMFDCWLKSHSLAAIPWLTYKSSSSVSALIYVQ
ncbi:unnamed protein product [Brassica rapa subsp. trilocularis]